MRCISSSMAKTMPVSVDVVHHAATRTAQTQRSAASFYHNITRCSLVHKHHIARSTRHDRGRRPPPACRAPPRLTRPPVTTTARRPRVVAAHLPASLSAFLPVRVFAPLIFMRVPTLYHLLGIDSHAAIIYATFFTLLFHACAAFHYIDTPFAVHTLRCPFISSPREGFPSPSSPPFYAEDACFIRCHAA